MLNLNRTDPPEQPPATRRQELKFLERFVRWARKLNNEDLSMVVAFCANVQMAWNDGQPKVATVAEQVEQGTALPGLGAPIVGIDKGRHGGDMTAKVIAHREGDSLVVDDVIIEESDNAAN